MSLIAGAIAGGSVLNAVGSYFNYQNQKDQLSFQKKQWEQVKQREDTAVQRRAEDLKAAGFNRILAASGQGATTTQAPILSAPQMDTGSISKGAMDYINAITMDQQIKKSEMDIKVAEDQARLLQSNKKLSDINALKAATEIPKINAEKVLKMSEAGRVQADTRGILHDLRISEETGMPLKGGDTSPAGLVKTTGGGALKLKELNEKAEREAQRRRGIKHTKTGASSGW